MASAAVRAVDSVVDAVMVASAWEATCLPAIADDDLNRNGLLKDRLSRQRRGDGRLFLATLDGRLVGHVYVWTEPAEEHELRKRLPGVPLIMNLWVHADVRRAGIARKLMTAAEQWLSRAARQPDGRRYRQVALGVEHDNTAAIALYEASGYRQQSWGPIPTMGKEFDADGRTKHYVDEWCEIYEKKLR